MRRRIIILLILVIAAGGGFAWWWFGHNGDGNGPLVLYGNVDLRQVDLAFIDSGRIAAVQVDEGSKVKKGEVLARLDTSRIAPQVAQAEAQVAAQAGGGGQAPQRQSPRRHRPGSGQRRRCQG